MSVHPEAEKAAPPPYNEQKDEDLPAGPSPNPSSLPEPPSSSPAPVKEFLSRPQSSLTNTGPTSYPPRKFALVFINTVLFVQFSGRGLCGLLIVLDPDIRAHSLFLAVLFAIVYIIAGLYIFFLSFIKSMPDHKSHMTLHRFHFIRLLRTPFPYIFLIDQSVILLLLYTSKWAFSDFSLIINVIATVIMVMMNSAGFLVITRFEVSAHEPCNKLDNYFYSVKCVEDSETNDNQLRIIESRAFWIIIANIGQNPIEGHLLIVRKIGRHEEPILIPIFLAEPLVSGVEITLVPETKNIPGACKIAHFRSFGRDKGEIETRIYVGKKSRKYSTRRLEIFEGHPAAIV